MSDVNRNISDYSQQIQLKPNIINQTVKERIVEPLTPTPKIQQEKNFMKTILNNKIIKDIFCGLYCRGKTQRDLRDFFLQFSKVSREQLNYNELMYALDQLTISANQQDRAAFVDNLLISQEEKLGYKSQNVNIEFLVGQLNRDFSQSKDQMLNDIMFDMAVALTQSKILVADTFAMFDKNDSGFVMSDEFAHSILENYLSLSSILNTNKLKLL